MKKILLIFTLFFVLGCIVYAQSSSSIESELLESINNNAAGDVIPEDGHTAIVEQYGESNTGIINQFQAQYGDIGNYGNVYQDGDFNTAILYQYGGNINTSITQNGGNNYADIEISGYNINGDISQDGYNNSIDQTISGNDFDYLIQQNGNNNLFIQDETGVTENFEITQQGDGITIIIE